MDSRVSGRSPLYRLPQLQVSRLGCLLDLAVAIVLTCAVCAFGQAMEPEERETVSGTVINSVSRAPVPRALVHSTDDRFATFTDSAGRFEFKLPKQRVDDSGSADEVTFFAAGAVEVHGSAGTLVLEARKPGYLNPPAGISLWAAGTPDEGITIELVPEAVIHGRISLSTGDPALGVTVELLTRQVHDGIYHWVQRAMGQANSNGEFRFADLPAGGYKVLTRESLDTDPVARIPGGQEYGFAPSFYPGVPAFEPAESISLTAGEIFQADLALTRQPYYPVKIPVEGAADGGINITVSLQEQRGPGYALGYNQATRVIQGMLPKGNFVIEAVSFGPNPASGVAHLRVAGPAVETPPLVLTPNGTVNLSVRGEFGDTKWDSPISGNDGKRNFTVRGVRSYLDAAMNPADEFATVGNAAVRPPLSPNDDSLVLENLPPGRYWLRLTARRGYVASATAGSVDLLHEPLVVGPGSNTPVEVLLRDDFAHLEGTVADLAGQASSAEGRSPAQAWIYCVPLPEGAGQFQQLGVSQDGKFAADLAPGSYRILAFASHENLPYRDAEAMKAYDGKGQVIHLAGGEKASVQLQLIGNP